MGKKVLDRALVFGTGASFYSLLETIWRGHTHWSMSLTGGLVLLTVYTAERRTHHTLWRRCLRSAGIITAYEFVVGCLVNLRLGWQVWDYSSQPGNVLGQVCPLFCFLWLMLSLPVLLLCGWLGPVGLAMGMMLITSSISRADGEGLPYLFPLHPACSGALRDGFVRMPWPILAKDPFTLKKSRKGKKL